MPSIFWVPSVRKGCVEIMRLPARRYRTVGSLLETMERKSSAVHVLLAKIVTELTKRVSFNKMAQPDTFSAPDNFEVRNSVVSDCQTN